MTFFYKILPVKYISLFFVSNTLGRINFKAVIWLKQYITRVTWKHKRSSYLAHLFLTTKTLAWQDDYRESKAGFVKLKL